MIATLDRHLNEQWYKFSIILRGREFHSFKQVLRGKARKLRQSGIGKRSNKDRSLTEEEKEVLWEADKFGSKLQKSLFLLCGGFWRSSLVTAAVKNTTQWKWKIFNSAKTIKAWSSCSLLKVQRRPDRADCRARREIFSHVCSLLEEKGFRLLSSSSERRPQNMRWYGPFYLSIKRNLGLNDNLWFKTQPMGENGTISNMMKTIVAGAWRKSQKVHKSQCKKDNNQQVEESKRWKLRICQSHRPQKRTIPWRLRWSRSGRATLKKKRRAVCGITTTVAPLAPVNMTAPVPLTLAGPSMTASKENQFHFQVFKLRISPWIQPWWGLRNRPWWTRSPAVKCLPSLADRSELLSFQNCSPVLVNAELSLSRMIRIFCWLL